MRGQRVIKRSAIARAQQRWGEAAVEARTTLRERGVSGPLRNLDEIASGRRGHAIPRGMVRLASDLRGAGMPDSEILSLFCGALREMIGVEHADTGPSAA